MNAETSRNAEPGHLWDSACGFIYEDISRHRLLPFSLFCVDLCLSASNGCCSC